MPKISEPIIMFFDTDGSPLEAGRVYIGEAGMNAKTNQVSVYLDEALTTPLAQPIITVGGRPSYLGNAVNIYIAETSFSISTENRNGVPVITNGSGAPFALSSDLASTATGKGAALIGWKQSGTGAVDRTVYAKLLDGPVSPEDFDAAGDGTTDDTAAWQAALDTGRNVTAASGKTYLVGPLSQNTAGQQIDVTGATLKLAANSIGFILELTGEGAKVIGGTFDGNKAAGQSTVDSYYDHAAVRLGADYTSVEGIHSKNSAGLGIKGGSFDYMNIRNCRVDTYDLGGIFVECAGADATGNAIEGNTVIGSKIGIYLKGENSPFTYKQKNARICNNYVEGPSSGATTADICITFRGINSVVSNNVTLGGDMGISCDMSSDSVISNNRIGATNGPTGYGIEVNAGGNTVSSNYIDGCVYSITGSGNTFNMDYNTFVGNVCDNPTSRGFYINPGASVTARHLTFTGNVIQFAAAATNRRGIYLTRDCKYSHISGNNFVGPGNATSGGRAIYLDSVNGYVSIIGNRFSGWERPVALYNTTATAYTDISFNSNDCSYDMGSDGLWLNAEGTATVGNYCTQIGNTRLGSVRDYFSKSTNLIQMRSTGTPEGVVTAGVGSIFQRTDGGAGTTFYVKESGTGNTGWVAK